MDSARLSPLGVVLCGCTLLTNPAQFEQRDAAADAGAFDDANETPDSTSSDAPRRDGAEDASISDRDVGPTDADAPVDSSMCDLACGSDEVCAGGRCLPCDDDGDGFFSSAEPCLALEVGSLRPRDCDDADPGLRPLWTGSCTLAAACPDPALAEVSQLSDRMSLIPAVRVSDLSSSESRRRIDIVRNDVNIVPKLSAPEGAQWLVVFRQSAGGYGIVEVAPDAPDPVGDVMDVREQLTIEDSIVLTELVARHESAPSSANLWAAVSAPSPCDEGVCHDAALFVQTAAGGQLELLAEQPGRPDGPLVVTRSVEGGTARAIAAGLSQLANEATTGGTTCEAGVPILSYSTSGVRCVDNLDRTTNRLATAAAGIFGFRVGGTVLLWDGVSADVVPAVPVLGTPILVADGTRAEPSYVLVSDVALGTALVRPVSPGAMVPLGAGQQTPIPYTDGSDVARLNASTLVFAVPTDHSVELWFHAGGVGFVQNEPLVLLDEAAVGAPIVDVEAVRLLAHKVLGTSEVMVAAHLSIDRGTGATTETWVSGVRLCD